MWDLITLDGVGKKVFGTKIDNRREVDHKRAKRKYAIFYMLGC